MLQYGILAVISFDIITGAVVGVDYFARCTFAPDYVIVGMLLLRRLCGVSIQFIKLILGLLISILLIIALNRYSHPFSLLPNLFL